MHPGICVSIRPGVFKNSTTRSTVKKMCAWTSHAGRFRSKQIYKQEMKQGHILLNLDKLLMFGMAGSGKTCSLAALLGLAPPDIRCSTPLMKRPIEVVFMDVDGEKRWTIQTAEQLQDKIAEVIRSRIPQQQPVAQSSGVPASSDKQPSHTTATQSAQPTPEKTSSSTSEAARKSTVSSEEKCRTREQQEAQGRLDSLLHSSTVDEGLVSLINKASPSLLPILQLRQFLVLDSGGQLELLEMMPIFLKGASKFIYVLKLNESLDERAMIRYFKDGKLVWEYEAYMTNEASLRQCVRSMRSLNNKNPDIPPATMLFLATHRDMVAQEKLLRVLDTLHKRLREILLPQFREQLIFRKGEDFVFTLNAAKPEKEDKECTESIRECLSEIGEGGSEVKVPLRWYVLYQKLLEVASGLGKKVLPREQCQQVAESMEINYESCGLALNFFDGLNILFYFPDILPQLVFMDPQMLLDKVSELVEETYHMRQGKKAQPILGDRLRFRDYAQVTEKFLGEFKSHYEPPLFTPKELVTLLKGLLVFAEMSEDVYFMPCLLQVVDWEVVEKYRVSGEKALALHFPKSGPLMGMFCSTVAYLMSPDNCHPCPWRVVKNKTGAPKCLHRNIINFKIPNYTGTISLIDHFTHFELHLCTHPKKEPQLWELAQDAVFAGLKKAGKTIGYTNNTPIPAIVCPAHPFPAKPHPATVDKDKVWTCSEDPGKYGDVAEDTIPWMTVCTFDCEWFVFPLGSVGSNWNVFL